MTVIAKSAENREFFYNAESAHKVGKKNAKSICEELNKIRWDLKAGQVWHIHEVDQYDTAYYYAEFQKFYIRNGYLREAH